LLSRQNARREKRSQKSQKDFFDKLAGVPYNGTPASCIRHGAPSDFG
jgi:hypothetical protein